MESESAIFNRLTLLLGAETMDKIRSKRVIIFGVGGVGSWCAESLIRSGISHLTIVDSDEVSITNVNRQLEATTKTVGQPKVMALKERLLDINPEAEIQALQEVYSAQTAGLFHLEAYDYIIDAIDTLENKTRLILHATSCPGKLYSAMGAALKMDPTKVSVAEFWEVQGCPLARAIRKKFKKKDEYPGKKFQCVFSAEVLPNKGAEENPDLANEEQSPAKAVTNGTMVHITAIFGFTIAGLVMQDLCTGN
ncbi:MAG: tRNA threonylcarbamoyladenosine dehydratase [Bacteroidales bacterium]|nr:tRNA threonylcarbamoyladenosine dehydratase [Bacteroidales bacterium]